MAQLFDLLPGRVRQAHIAEGRQHPFRPAFVIDEHLAAHLHPGLGAVEEGETMP
jgi:hypothetical protein